MRHGSRWRRGLIWLVPLLLVAPALAGDASLLIGRKDLDLDLDPGDDFLEPLEEQEFYGVMLNFGGEDWPVSLAIDLILADDDVSDSYSYSYYGYTYSYSAKVEIDTQEIDVGVRKFFGENRVQGYVGGGAAYIDGEVSIDASVSGPFFSFDISESESDSGFGFYLNGGVRFLLGQRAHVGLDVRYSDVTIDFDQNAGGDDLDIGGLYYGAFVGFRWGQ